MRSIVVVFVAALLATGCSSSKHIVVSPPTTTSTPSRLSATEGDRQLCAAYEAFWNTPYAGGEPDAKMLERERTLVNAAEATPDKSLHDAVQGVIDGELGLPYFYLHDTATRFQQNLSGLPPDTKTALAAVQRSDSAVRSKCRAAGRAVAG